MGRLRKPIGVWLLLMDGEQWCYDRHPNVDQAMKTARALILAARYNEAGPLFCRPSRVWIAPPPQVALRPGLARYRKGGR